MRESTKDLVSAGLRVKKVNEAQVAIAAWPDNHSLDANEDGMCTTTIKGRKLLQRIVQTNKAEEALVTFIPCDNREEAQNMYALYGDGAARTRMN
jgi:hypothetical protein